MSPLFQPAQLAISVINLPPRWRGAPTPTPLGRRPGILENLSQLTCQARQTTCTNAFSGHLDLIPTSCTSQPTTLAFSGLLSFGQSLGPSPVTWREEVVRGVVRLREELQEELQEGQQPQSTLDTCLPSRRKLQPLVVLHLLSSGRRVSVSGSLPPGTNGTHVKRLSTVAR